MSGQSENFQVDLGGILELLSDHLYSTQDVFVRELLQNATDAIAARRAAEPAHAGRIMFECDEAAGTLTVIDDGIGLTADEARSFLSRVGASIKRGEGADRSTYLGQFGVGILSCFTVAEELIVLTQRLGEPEGAGVRWTARADGTFQIDRTDRPLQTGTRVILRLNPNAKRYASSGTMQSLVERFGKYLAIPVHVNDDWNINEAPPWETDLSDDDERSRLVSEFGWQFGRQPLDVLPIAEESLGLKGVAFIVPELAANATEQSHEVYLKRMFVTDRPGRLLPRWAGFTRCVLNVNGLRPTASREAFYEDEAFAAVGELVGAQLREYLTELAGKDPARLALLLEFQDHAFRQLACEDDAFFDTVIDLLPFETSMGRMTFGDFRREHSVVRIAPTTDQFRSVAALAAARGTIIFNGGYTYHAELLERAVSRSSDLSLEPTDGRELIEQLGRASKTDTERFERIREAMDGVLAPFGVQPRLASFEPEDLPAVYGEGADSNLARSLRSAREISRGLWSDLLEAVSGSVDASQEHAVLCLNASNPVIRQLLASGSATLAAESARLLYVQALLLSQQPLTVEETTAFCESLGTMIARAIEAEGGGGEALQ